MLRVSRSFLFSALYVSVPVALVVAPSAGLAQRGNGDGFMFRKPSGSVAFRGGYALANTEGEPYTLLAKETTVGPRSFDAFNIGVDFDYFLGRRLDAVLSLDLSTRSKTASYRHWEENGQPITHQTTLGRLGLAGGLRYNFFDRGRQISALAFIPTRTNVYVGALAGVMSYDLVQEGDFVESTDQSTTSIHHDLLRSSHTSFLAQTYAGIDRRISARWSAIGEVRYTHSQSRLVNDYAGLGSIQLSGLALNVGASVRF